MALRTRSYKNGGTRSYQTEAQKRYAATLEKLRRWNEASEGERMAAIGLHQLRSLSIRASAESAASPSDIQSGAQALAARGGVEKDAMGVTGCALAGIAFPADILPGIASSATLISPPVASPATEAGAPASPPASWRARTISFLFAIVTSIACFAHLSLSQGQLSKGQAECLTLKPGKLG